MKKLLKLYKRRNLTLGSVESMTGGLFAARITDVPGSSAVFKGTIVTYNVEEKINIVGVSKSTIEQYGVVSKEVAEEMAEKGRKLLNVDVCVAVTGNAGPTCEPGGEPAGVFYVAASTKNGTTSRICFKKSKRNGVRNNAVLALREEAYLKAI